MAYDLNRALCEAQDAIERLLKVNVALSEGWLAECERRRRAEEELAVLSRLTAAPPF